jgi:hypothetical protein
MKNKNKEKKKFFLNRDLNPGLLAPLANALTITPKVLA